MRLRRLRVVTWNVGRLYSPTSDNKLDDADLPRVARVLYELDPDVALLQEFLDERQLHALLALLPGYEGRIATRCRYDRHVGALARASLQPEFEQLLLDYTGRGLVGVTVDVGGARAFAIAVHLDAFSPGRRRLQAEELTPLLEARREAIVAVGGDFNLDPDFSARAGFSLDPETFAQIARGLVDAGRAAGPTLMGLMRIDHLLAGGPLLERLVTRVSPARRLPMGDHDPLVGDLHLRRSVADAASVVDATNRSP